MGTNIRPVTAEPIRALQWWDWAPNGDLFVVVQEQRGVSVFQLFDREGIEAPRTLAEGITVSVPVFRPPDSTEIMFRGETAAGVGLYVMNADGTGQRAIIRPTSTRGEHDLREPRYSPDGSLIAYQPCGTRLPGSCGCTS